MARHTISHAGNLYWGNAVWDGQRGLPMSPLMKVDLGVPNAASTTAIVNAQAVAAAGAVTLAGTNPGANYGRVLNVVSSNAGDTSQVVTITGKDYRNQTMVENITLNGTTTVVGVKAFASITSVVVSAAMAGNLSVGTTTKLGLPFRIAGKTSVLASYVDTTEELATASFTAGATNNPQTATTSDPRGFVTPATAPNGSRRFIVWMSPYGADSEIDVYGYPHFTG